MPKLSDVNHQEAVNALQKAGFEIKRQSKHIIMSDGVRVLTNPEGIQSIRLRWLVLYAMRV